MKGFVTFLFLISTIVFAVMFLQKNKENKLLILEANDLKEDKRQEIIKYKDLKEEYDNINYSHTKYLIMREYMDLLDYIKYNPNLEETLDNDILTKRKYIIGKIKEIFPEADKELSYYNDPYILYNYKDIIEKFNQKFNN